VVCAGVDRRRGADARHRDRGEAVRRRPVAELAVLVPTPAADRVVSQEGAGVALTGRDRRRGGDAGDRDRGEAVRRRPVAELASVVGAPAADRAVIEEGAGVGGAGADRGDGRRGGSRNRPGRDEGRGHQEERETTGREAVGMPDHRVDLLGTQWRLSYGPKARWRKAAIWPRVTLAVGQ